jgi:hypothetical protein
MKRNAAQLGGSRGRRIWPLEGTRLPQRGLSRSVGASEVQGHEKSYRCEKNCRGTSRVAGSREEFQARDGKPSHVHPS